MPFLAPRLSFPLVFSLGPFLGINDITRRRLGRIGRVFLRRSQFAFKFSDPLDQLLDHRSLLGDREFKSFNLSLLGVHADHFHNRVSWRNTTYGVGGGRERLPI
jgi:hypothetical protein